ncbi:hypothetical protein M9458_051971 [Cirrhinus mrigala]|uniref:Retrotransposon gag domain-containing protein n=1 Tax=Cirrhinus mrigala TaxID=683832 RepID=A0ABD0MSU7_CIRMR
MNASKSMNVAENMDGSDKTPDADFTAGPFSNNLWKVHLIGSLTSGGPLDAFTPVNSISSISTPLVPVPAPRGKVSQPKPANVTYDVTPVSTPLTSVINPPVVPSMSSFCTQPPIRLEFPTFGDSCETSDVLNFIERCENYLDVQPLPSGELIGTLSTVLKGPALSWWKAEKSKAKDWQSFKKAFMAAFLPDDYLTEVEDKLRSLVQQPCQRLRDFAYDYHALCLKWKPDMSEDEMGGGLFEGDRKTVEQLVKVGSKVEKDYMGAKDYWQKVGGQKNKEKANKRSTERFTSRDLAGLSIAQPHPLNSLLLVPITVKGKEVKAVLDTVFLKWAASRRTAQTQATSLPQAPLTALFRRRQQTS